MRRVFVCSTAVLLASAVTAAADSPKLKGQYAFTGTAACLFSIGGTQVNPPNTALPSFNVDPNCATETPGPNGCPDLRPTSYATTGNEFVFSNSSAVEGIRTFDGNGNGTVKGSEVVLTVPPTPGPASNQNPHFPASAATVDFQYQFTYTVNGDGSFTADVVPGSFTLKETRGPRSGETGTVANFPRLTGMIGQDGKTLTIATLDVPTTVAQVETVTFSNGDVWPRICHRSRVLVKIGDGGDDNGPGRDNDR